MKVNFKHFTIVLGFILDLFLFFITSSMENNHPKMDWVGLWIGDYIITILFIILVACAFDDLNR